MPNFKLAFTVNLKLETTITLTLIIQDPFHKMKTHTIMLRMKIKSSTSVILFNHRYARQAADRDNAVTDVTLYTFEWMIKCILSHVLYKQR